MLYAIRICYNWLTATTRWHAGGKRSIEDEADSDMEVAESKRGGHRGGYGGGHRGGYGGGHRGGYGKSERVIFYIWIRQFLSQINK